MDSLITTKLREHALVLRKMVKSADPSVRASIGDTKDSFMREIHSILTIMLGPPPCPTEAFTWQYYDANGKFHELHMTPIEFAASLSSRQGIRACQGIDVRELCSLINDPRNPYDRLLTIDRLGNVVGGRPITYINVDMAVSLVSPRFDSCILTFLFADYEIDSHCDAPQRLTRLLRLRRGQIFQ
jgi:bleomycin hydrolase